MSWLGLVCVTLAVLLSLCAIGVSVSTIRLAREAERKWNLVIERLRGERS